MQPKSHRSDAPIATTDDDGGADREHFAQKQLGRMLNDKWRLDALLGVGGSATVFAATHRNGNRVAVKMLHPLFSARPADRERFLREGYLSNSVDHPDAVRVLDDNVDEDGTVFLVMELFEGQPVVSRWEAAAHRLPPGEALWIVDRLLSVLEVAHTAGIIHRDIKPDNLFLTTEGRLKVLDFGIARLGDVGTGSTLQGFILGTPGFAAPEQARGDWNSVDARADLWSVGATLFALVTGKVVHQRPTPRSHLLATSTEPAPSVREVDSTVPSPVATVIDRALAFQPEERFQSAAEMRQAVRSAYRLVTGEQLPEDLLRSTGASIPPQPLYAASTLGSPGVRPAPKRPRAGRALSGALAAGALVAGVFVYFVTRSQQVAPSHLDAQPSVSPDQSVSVSPTPTEPNTAAAEPAPSPSVASTPLSIAPVVGAPEATAPSAAVVASSTAAVPPRSGSVPPSGAISVGSRPASPVAPEARDTGHTLPVTSATPPASLPSPRLPAAVPPPAAKPARTGGHRLDFVDERR